MYTVVIPTLWYGKEIEGMLPVFEDHPLVGEVIVVDNNFQNRPAWIKSREWNKTSFVDFGRNIFVNPAWNYGIEKSRYDKICLCSDDVTLDSNVLEMVHDQLTEDKGCIGVAYESWLYVQFSWRVPPQIKNMESHENHYGYANLLFLNKKNFTPIPDDLKIYSGDSWIIKSYLNRNVVPKSLIHCNVYTSAAVSTNRSDFDEVKKNDVEKFTTVYNTEDWELFLKRKLDELNTGC